MKGYILIILLLISVRCYSQSIIQFDSSNHILEIGEKIYIYQDVSKNLGFDEISSPEFDEKFKLSTRTVPNFGITNTPIWIKIQVQNQTNQKLLFEIDNPNFDTLIYYYPNEQGGYNTQMAGTHVVTGNPEFRSTNFLFSLNQTPKIQTYYFCIRHTGTTLLPIRLGDSYEILQELNYSNILMAGYFGVLVALLLYNLFLGISIRDYTYYFYVVYVFGFGVNIFFMKGFNNLLLSDYKIPFYYLTPVFFGLGLISMILFTLRFLNIRAYSLVLFYILLALALIVPLYIALRFSAYSVASILIVQSSIILSSFFCLISGIYIYFKGYRPAKYYLLAWSCFWVFVIIYILIINDFLPFYSFTPNLLPIGSELEMVLLSFALADRINVLRVEKFNIQGENIRLVKEQNSFLEEKVEERTIELADKNMEIEAQNEELKQQKEEVVTLNNRLEEIVELRTEELKETIDNLAQQNQNLEQFSFIVSHNLRSPVARLMGLVSIFDYENPQNASNITYLNYINQTAHNLDTLIRDLTNVISVRNSLGKSKEDILWDDLVNACLTILEGEIFEVKARIEFNLMDDEPVYGIRVNLQSILYNLISNAIKYRSPNRIPEIIIETKIVDGFWCLSVKDNGLGMNLENIDSYKIFGLYQRLHSHVEGKGLGLYLVKTQVEALGGAVEVESKLNEGTTFRVYFPKISIESDILQTQK